MAKTNTKIKENFIDSFKLNYSIISIFKNTVKWDRNDKEH
jgi:hypothetical protein